MQYHGERDFETKSVAENLSKYWKNMEVNINKNEKMSTQERFKETDIYI